MRLQRRLVFQGYEQKLQETRNEREAETKRVERLSSILAKKMDSAKMERLSERVA
jgi:hypothetical protein